MTKRNRRQPLRTGGSVWGPERVRLDISLQELADISGVNKGFLSRMEHGRMIPTADEYQKVTAALRDVAAARQVPSSDP